MDDEDSDTGGSPEVIVGCTACGNTYPAQQAAAGVFRPIGTDGSCECGNDEFESLAQD